MEKDKDCIFDWVERILIFGPPILSFFIFLASDECHSNSCYYIAFSVISMFVASALEWRCDDQMKSQSDAYDAELYAMLRAERDQYTIFTGVAALLSFFLKASLPAGNNILKWCIIFGCVYLIIVLAVYYRRLSYLIYTMEAKRAQNVFVTMQRID